MWEFLNQLDTQLLIAIHKGHNAFGDAIFPLVREKVLWIPLYVFLFVFVVFNFKKKGWWFIAFFFFTVGITDMLSSKLIKYSVKRMRPCHLDTVESQLEMLVPCGGPYSFTSSHAANHFALAVFIALTLGRVFPVIRWPLYIWALMIGFAQVYVGVHYPLDILGGAVAGGAIGAAVAWYFNLRFRFDGGT